MPHIRRWMYAIASSGYLPTQSSNLVSSSPNGSSHFIRSLLFSVCLLRKRPRVDYLASQKQTFATLKQNIFEPKKRVHNFDAKQKNLQIFRHGTDEYPFGHLLFTFYCAPHKHTAIYDRPKNMAASRTAPQNNRNSILDVQFRLFASTSADCVLCAGLLF